MFCYPFRTVMNFGRNYLLSAAIVLAMTGQIRAQNANHQWAVVLHGGAGVIERAKLSPEMETAYRMSLRGAIEKAGQVLQNGGSAVDAVEAAIRIMEGDPLFNAGRGAVFTANGRNELDSAIMDGSNLKAGAVAGVTRTRHPITLARTVMEKSQHVILIGSGADEFARENGLEQVDPSFFFTERRWQNLVDYLNKQHMPIPPRPAGAPAADGAPTDKDDPKTHQFGTVGVVALDRKGNVAAGTSTGGTTGKRWGRVGDSPIIGAGTYAANESCAVSATGTGEYFIRLTVAREVCALVQYEKMPLQRAADDVIQRQLTKLGGDGGIISLTRDGQLAWSFNTSGMYRARLVHGGAPEIAIFKDEQ